MPCRFCGDMQLDCCEKEQTINSKEHSELAGTLTSSTITLKDKILDDDVSVIEAERSDTTSTAMMLFNNGYVVIIMDTSSMMDNTLQVTIQPSMAKHAIYYYFSSTFEVAKHRLLIQTHA